MLRRALAGIPVLALACAVLGVALAERPAAAVVAAVALGAAVAVGLAAVFDRRVAGVTQRVLRFAQGDTRPGPASEGSVEWRRLSEALDAVGASLDQRFFELADERARIQRLLDDLPLAVLLFTPSGLAYANPTAGRLFTAIQAGERQARVLGGDGLEDAVQETAETGRTTEFDVSRDGRELRARTSRTADGEVALVLTDLTESRRTEAIRRDFVTNASHELKTPVAGMQALADSLILAVERDPERARRMLDRLRGEAVRLAQLVRDLLDLARLEEVTAQRARRVDLGEVVRLQLERLAPLAQGRGVALLTDLDGDASVVAVPEDLRLIAGNLMENAILYNREGGHVSVVVVRRDGEVHLTVTDNGMGIPPGDRDRIFERFYRVDKGRSRAEGGTGLGLSLVRHAIQRHGGRITLESVPGEGSTFTVVLPVEGSPSGLG